MDRIGRYEILGELGRGAMGVVYLARDPKIGREVAIKTIKLADQAAEDEVGPLRERLMREAQAAGRLSHPGIVTIYDVDEQDGVSYIAMEFVEGDTLERKLRAEGRIEDLGFVAHVLRRAGDALDYAHGKGIVHRDVKPGNVMLTAAGDVKLMDFGIARAGSSNLTQTGTVMGTPSYMSPEQVKGEELDGRSDQFSLAVIAYEMLTGRKPFVGENLTAVIYRIVSSEAQPPRSLQPWIDPDVDAVIVRALSKDREQRFGGCGEFARTFARAAGVETATAAAGMAAIEETQAFAGATRRGAAGALPLANPVDATGASRHEHLAPKDPALGTGSVTLSDAKLPPLKRTGRFRRAAAGDEDGGGWGGRLALALLLAAAVGLGAAWSLRPDLFDGLLGMLRSDPPAQSSVVAEPAPEPIPEPPPVAEPVRPSVAASEPQESPLDETRPEKPAPEAAIVAAANPAPPATSTAPAPKAEPKPAAPRPAAKAAPKAEPKPEVFVSIYFRTSPMGAEVSVDKRAEWTCTTPCRIEGIPAGFREIEANLAGYYPATRQMELDANTPGVIELRLEDARVTTLISSEPEGAEIYIDGRKQPERTNAKIPLPRGTYQVKVAMPGYLEADQVLVVERGEIPLAKFTLRRNE